MQQVLANCEERMKKSISALETDYLALRTGRASAAVFDKIRVDYYGQETPLNQVASISVPEARLVVIQPWDKSLLSIIEKAIQKSDLGFNPSNDGKLLRINFPPLTQDRRKAGFTLDEFDRYVQSFKKLPMPGYEGMARGEGWYRPMLEVADYLAASGFQVWVVSGTDRFIVRGIVSGSPLRVPPERIIGSDEAVAATGQDGADGLQYQLREGDEVVLEGRFVVKNLKMNKVAAIVREIGRRPVLAFGNSTGDSSMAAWATRGNPARSLAFMLCCDDVVRENGNPAKAEKMRAICAENGWIPVSMKDDWKTIYGDGVSRY